tara:strand:+ start:523 stop:627 length:105 start_codon:yes stop_codon:yes gene_type:complete
MLLKGIQKANEGRFKTFEGGQNIGTLNLKVENDF